MSTYPHTYNTITKVTENGIKYYFVSEGRFDIIKAIHYAYALNLKGRRVYNLAFGDYDFRTGILIDDQTSNNGDAYRVFQTVLSTIPKFFSAYPNAFLMVWGSDSKKGYQQNCRLTCKKNCAPDMCRNVHRRIAIYQNYLNKNLIGLSGEYKFYGGFMTDENQLFMEDYRKGHLYPSIIIKKKRRKKI